MNTKNRERRRILREDGFRRGLLYAEQGWQEIVSVFELTGRTPMITSKARGQLSSRMIVI